MATFIIVALIVVSTLSLFAIISYRFYKKIKCADAIIAIANDGSAKLIIFLTTEFWKLQAQDDFDMVGELEFDEPPGLYYAYCYVEKSVYFSPEGESEDEVMWNIIKPLYLVDTSLRVYNFTANALIEILWRLEQPLRKLKKIKEQHS